MYANRVCRLVVIGWAGSPFVSYLAGCWNRDLCHSRRSGSTHSLTEESPRPPWSTCLERLMKFMSRLLLAARNRRAPVGYLSIVLFSEKQDDVGKIE